jgi:predicted phosphodiesterase
VTDPLFRVGLLADVQYADDDADERLDRHYRASLAKLREAVAEFNRNDLAFVVHLGDLVDHDLENAGPVLDILAGSSAPVHHVLGNHDFASYGSPTGRSDRATVIKAYDMPAAYYAVDHQDWRFLVLDTNEVGVIEHLPGTMEASPGEELLARVKSQGRVNANPWNGTIGGAQRGWLAEHLEQAAADGVRAAILAHHPVHPDHHDNLLDDHELADWLAGFPALKIWICGHQHAGGYAIRHGIHYLTLNGVVQSTTNAYAIADLHQDRIVISGRGRQPSYELPIE